MSYRRNSSLALPVVFVALALIGMSLLASAVWPVLSGQMHRLMHLMP